ncbi:MAG TPA: hypothetical protein VMW24_00825 [Sedimentisphaerales bacterium]|nr:hypothetical protein [Sedimentisphaerales bacterium]
MDERTCNDCCKQEVCVVRGVSKAARDTAASMIQQGDHTEEQMNQLAAMWEPTRRIATLCPHFLPDPTRGE